MAYEDKGGEGSVSEWNEGNFKNIRLHEAQEMINTGKFNAFNLSEDKMSWNFQQWKAGIDVLYEEGYSKYSDDEIREVEAIKKLLETCIDVKPPFKRVTEYIICGKKDKFTPLKENQEKIWEFLRMYEKIVKKYNDVHGLSTRNKEEEDWRGL